MAEKSLVLSPTKWRQLIVILSIDRQTDRHTVDNCDLLRFAMGRCNAKAHTKIKYSIIKKDCN